MAAPWLPVVDDNASGRLICLPYAGGGTADYRAWRDGLPTTVDLCPVVLAGRERRLSQTPISRMPELVDAMIGDLAPLLRRTPYALYGHSMGAWLAFELAREARRRHLPAPVHLIVGARRAPHLPSRHAPLSHLPDAAFVQAVQDRYRAIPEPVLRDPGIMALFLPALRADLTLLDQYAYVEEAPLDVPITALFGREDTLVEEADVRAWHVHTTGRFEARGLYGGHFFLRDQAEDTSDLVAQLLATGFR